MNKNVSKRIIETDTSTATLMLAPTVERISVKTFGRAEAIRSVFNPIIINGKALLPKLDKTKDEKK